MYSTEQLRQWDRRHVWHPFTQMQDWEQEEPIVITRGEGSWLIDTDGNRYLDGVASMWTNVHGHCRRELNEALKAQVDRLEHSTLLGLAGEQSIILARRLAEITPPGLDRFFYSDNGSTAMEVAVKMAFQYQVHKGSGGTHALHHLPQCLSRRHPRCGQRRRHRYLPQHLPAAAVRDHPGPIPLLLPLRIGLLGTRRPAA